jgi:hypothetical protein
LALLRLAAGGSNQSWLTLSNSYLHRVRRMKRNAAGKSRCGGFIHVGGWGNGLSRPGPGVISGKVTYAGIPAKSKRIDMSKQPECIKLHPEGLSTEDVVTGPGNALQNVLVYISAGGHDTAPVPTTAATFDQQACHYTTHVLPLRVGQDVSISNRDPFNHNIHPMAKINREWNRIQLPGTPPFRYSYENEEFIPVKCNIHSWMKAYFIVLKTPEAATSRLRRTTSVVASKPANGGQGKTGQRGWPGT